MSFWCQNQQIRAYFIFKRTVDKKRDFCHHLLTKTYGSGTTRGWVSDDRTVIFGWTIPLIYSYMERDFIAMRFYCRQSCENRQQNVKLIVTLSLCTWLGRNIVRTHCVVDTCLVLLVGFWGTFRWNVESPHHISLWTPFCDRKRSEEKHTAWGNQN